MRKLSVLLVATVMTLAVGLNVNAKDVNEMIVCDLSVSGGDGSITIFDQEGTFEKEFYFEDGTLYEDDVKVDGKVELPKDTELTVGVISDQHYHVADVTMTDSKKEEVGALKEELPALSAEYNCIVNDDVSLNIKFEKTSNKYIDLGVTATTVETFSARAGSIKLCDYLGIDGVTYYNFLRQHSTDNTYIGTPYVWGYKDGANGFSGWKDPAGSGMNCEGFVDNVLKQCGASHPMSFGAGGGGWVNTMNRAGIEYYDFGSKADMLNSGILEYGDIIWMFDGSPSHISDYHHIGIFVGNTSSDDRFWHSVNYTSNQYGTVISGNRITNIIPAASGCRDWVVVKAGAISKTYIKDVRDYKDVHENDWFYSYVEDVSKQGIMTGMNETTFAPSDKMSRGQLATVIYRMHGSPQTSYERIFSDVLGGAFYSVPVTWASKFGVITGYQDGSGRFGYADDITREQLATMLYRYGDKLGCDMTVSKNAEDFPDGDKVSAFAKDGICWCLGTGIITGDQGKINPQGTVNRAVAATMISRFTESISAAVSN